MMEQEKRHLEECRQFIADNIRLYEKKAADAKKETEILYSAVQKGETELYDQLIVSQDLLEHMEKSLEKNKASYEKPYFGRIDFKELQYGREESLYIGKNGINRGGTETVIIDWRAPVASVYYENPLGRGQYEVPEEEKIGIDLHLKRNFDIDRGELLGFYDSDVASNDELLVKYLAKNKEAVLGDIIATIQKEQNEIIRETPYTNIIVQGVAGSGKTTVALHRISYILYNYGKRFTPEEFCIIGSSDMLLNYIASGLPQLDVSNVGQLRMDAFVRKLLGPEWKDKYQYHETAGDQSFKSKIAFMRDLERYLDKLEKIILPKGDIEDEDLGVILSARSIEEALKLSPDKSLRQKFLLLKDRLRGRIRMLAEGEKKKLRREKWSRYQEIFKWKGANRNAVSIYLDFLLEEDRLGNADTSETIEAVQKGKLDIYDSAAMLLIKKRITQAEDMEDYSQIVIDEAQDFGAALYYAIRKALPKCYFTVMGDVSQNIRYATGLNTWDDMLAEVFTEDNTKFRLLAKSYRNTIEISEYAGRVLDKASAGAYKIEPVIRHGNPVKICRMEEEEMAEKAASLAKEMLDAGHETNAVICRNQEEADSLRKKLAGKIEGLAEADGKFGNGVMILPIHQTKGLEFDSVILWNPSEENYGENEEEAKLLYVAVTRALHELYIVAGESLTKLLG